MGGIRNLSQADNMVSQLIRASAPLTLAFVTCAHINVQGANNLTLYYKYTKGNSSGLFTRFEKSLDKSNWYRELEQSQSGSGTTSYRHNDRLLYVTTTSQTRFEISKTLKNDCRWIRVSVKAKNSGTNAAVAITVVKSFTS